MTFLLSQTVLLLYLAVKNFLLAVYPEARKLGQYVNHFVRFDVVDEDIWQPQVLRSVISLAFKITVTLYCIQSNSENHITSGHNSFLIATKKP